MPKRPIHPNTLAALRPAKPGEVRNPTGRPKTPPDVKQALQAMLPQAVTRLGELLMSNNEKIALAATQVVLDRNLGKAVATKIDVKADLGAMHLQLLEDIRARRQERLGGQIVDVTPNENKDEEGA
jgi:hypothetical protein